MTFQNALTHRNAFREGGRGNFIILNFKHLLPMLKICFELHQEEEICLKKLREKTTIKKKCLILISRVEKWSKFQFIFIFVQLKGISNDWCLNGTKVIVIKICRKSKDFELNREIIETWIKKDSRQSRV